MSDSTDFQKFIDAGNAALNSQNTQPQAPPKTNIIYLKEGYNPNITYVGDSAPSGINDNDLAKND